MKAEKTICIPLKNGRVYIIKKSDSVLSKALTPTEEIILELYESIKEYASTKAGGVSTDVKELIKEILPLMPRGILKGSVDAIEEKIEQFASTKAEEVAKEFADYCLRRCNTMLAENFMNEWFTQYKDK